MFLKNCSLIHFLCKSFFDFLSRRLLLSILFVSIFSWNAYSQSMQDVSKNSDCTTAFNIGVDTMVGPTTPPLGYGEKLEINGVPQRNMYSFTREHHTVWYEFEAVYTGILTFDLVPENASNDYDFLLFRGTAEKLCEQIKNRTVQPVRTNISRYSPEIGSKTGLSLEAKASFVHSGPGEDYSKALEVKKGERYLLVVDNVYKNGQGHSLYFHYHNVQVEQSSKEQAIAQEKTVERPRDTPTEIVEVAKSTETTDVKEEKKVEVIHLYDKPSVEESTVSKVKKLVPIRGNIIGKEQEGLKAVITCRDRTTGKLLASTSTENGSYELDIPVIKGIKEYRVEIFADGHFFTDTLFSIKNLAKVSQEGISRQLQPLEVGATFRISNINFYGDSPKPLPESIYVYQNILQIMEAYETMKIKVEGHTNGCHGGIESSTRLSIARATSVKNYLSRNGVDTERVDIKGWGCAKMLYPYPEDESEARLNRRVEIKILAL